MKPLITGATGFVGKCLAETLPPGRLIEELADGPYA